ncbi:MAG: LysR family transcriptional regulator [Pseudobdellovibrio sp.]
MALALINNLNLSHLKIFESVYRLKSMTLAAQELFLTQSGVSQHMKSLEESLGLELFIRNRSGLYSTEAADLLYKSYHKAFGEIEATLHDIKDPQHKELTGTLRIGIPTEFGNNIVIPFLSEWSKKHSQVKFDFVYGYGLSLIQMLEDGELDLAFIDSFQKNKKIVSKVVFQETLNLVASTQYLKKPFRENIKDLMALDFLEYEHKESILRLWFGYHYGKKNVNLNIRAWAMNVQGVASLVKQGMGAAILPDHLIEKLIKQGQPLHVFKGKRATLKNDISLTWLKDKPKTQAADDLIKYIIVRNS